MQTANTMATITEVMEKLRMKKMDNEFRWTVDGFTVNKAKFYQPEDLEIVKVYRFEGMSDPGDTSILYIIQANDGLIGYSLDSYGAYSDHDDEEGYDNFIRLISHKNHDEQMLFEL